MSEDDLPNTPPKKRPTPPREFQFKKGVSGNPKGRPPKKRAALTTGLANNSGFPFHDGSFLSLAQQEQHRLMAVKEGDRSEMMPALQAAIRRIGVDAVKGNPKAQQMFLNLTAEMHGPVMAEKVAVFTFWWQYVDDQTFHLVDEVRAGKPVSDPLPHPDDVELDFENLEVKIKGPTSRREKLHQDALLAELPDLLAQLRESEERLSASPTDKELRKRVRELKKMTDWCIQELGNRNFRRLKYEKLASVK